MVCLGMRSMSKQTICSFKCISPTIDILGPTGFAPAGLSVRSVIDDEWQVDPVAIDDVGIGYHIRGLVSHITNGKY